ncbi:MAG: MotA/TolQ/ExbB proton channel family protein [Chthoniobacteraceae bacterium]
MMKLRTHVPLALAILTSVMITASVLAQDTAAADKTSPAAEESVAPHKKSLWEQIKEGGWVMFPIAGCSILTVFLIVDGMMRTSAKRVLPEAHVSAVKNLFRQGDYVGAYNYCKANPCGFNNVCRVGVSLLGEGKVQVEEGVVGELAKENSGMQTYISYLSVIGVCTPMIGLLGTVTGMIRAFSVLGSSGIGDPSQLSAAIGEVLMATASGLFIAIPAFGAFYYLRARAAKVLHDIQDTINALFRKMPYEQLAGAHIGDDELYAAAPNWTAPAHAPVVSKH